MDIINNVRNRFEHIVLEEYTLAEYLEICKTDPMAYATAAERMLTAIGEPEIIDSSTDPRLARIFANKPIKRYSAFAEFYGMEEYIEQIVAYFKHAAQGLEEKKQILYLLGPVGGGKSSLAERIKALMQQMPFYAIKDSPVWESPLGLFDYDADAAALEAEYGIPKRYVRSVLSPWAIKRLQEFKGDISKFKIVKLRPSISEQIAIAKAEPGDENNHDISTLVGKLDIRKLEEYSQDDPDAYSYSGGLCKANRGILEFVEMFKAPIKMLHPLLTATQEGNYNGTEAISSIPFDGIILAHSNEAEWQSFKHNKHNEAFLDRVCVVKIPYCLRVSDEIKIYEKLIQNSSLKDAPCAPETLKMLAQFSILSRLKEPENSSIFAKKRVYDGENLKDIDPKAKGLQEYKDYAGVDEGMHGLSTRFCFKILSKVFNFDDIEIAANPVQLFQVLEHQLQQEQFPSETYDRYLAYIKNYLKPQYIDFLGKEIQSAYLESYNDYCQNIFDKYVLYAALWLQGESYVDPNTGVKLDTDLLNHELEDLEKPAEITNHKEFRNEIINFIANVKANANTNPIWNCYEKLGAAIEKKVLANIEELLPAIYHSGDAVKDNRKHEDFVLRMVTKGYTPKQVHMLCNWYLRVRKSS